MDMSELFKKAQELQSKMQETQSELASQKVQGVSGGGMVKVTANGQQEILSIDIEPEVIKVEEKELIEEMVVAAVNQALKEAKEMASKYMQNQAGDMFGGALSGFKFPGM